MRSSESSCKGARQFNFTDNKIRKLTLDEAETANQVEFSDLICSGLKIIVSRKTGKKVFYHRCQVSRGKRILIKIGSSDAIPVKEARSIANEHKLAVAKGEDPRRKTFESEITLADYGELYLKKAMETKVTWRDDIAKIRDFSNYFGNQPMKEVKPLTVKQYLESIRKRTSSSNANHYRAVLSKIFNDAIAEGIVDKNIIMEVKKYPPNKSIGRALDEQETTRLFEALRNDYNRQASVAIALLLNTGMRTGECLSIQHTDIDLKKRQIHLRGTTTKNGEDRIVYLSHQAVELIKEAKRFKIKGNPYLFPGKKKDQPLTSLRTTFARCKKNAAIAGRFRLHDTHHTYCTTLARLGVARPLMQSLMGHKTPSMIDYYTHLSQFQLAEASQKVSDFFSTVA